MPTHDIPKISELPLFGGNEHRSAMPEATQRYLQDHMHRVDYPAGALLLRAGMRSNYLAIVASGAIELRPVSGAPQMIGPGGVFGHEMMRNAAPSVFSVQTAMPTTLWVIRRSDWLIAERLTQASRPKPAQKTVPIAPKSLAANPLLTIQAFAPPVTIREASQSASQKKTSRFRFPWNGLAALLFLALVFIVLGPTLVGWTDFMLVRSALQSNNPALAERYLRLALDWRPASAALQDALGFVQRLQAQPDQAMQEFRRAVALSPDLASAQNNLGVVLLERGQASEALAHLKAAVDLDPGSPTYLVNLGNAYLGLGDSNSAMTAYRDAFALDPTHAVAQTRWAILALQAGRVVEARLVLEKAVAAAPDLALARQGLGAAILLSGQPAAALPELEIALRLDPQNSSTHLYLGLTLKALDRPMDAAIEFIQVLSLSQDPAYTNLARQNLQQVYSQLMPTGMSQGGEPQIGIMQKGGLP